MRKYNSIKIMYLTFMIILLSSICWSGNRKFKEIKRFDVKEARQGIAVDDKYIYIVGTRQIGKYDKKTEKLVGYWKDEEDGQIIHLDSGVIVDGKLYCAHSNYPDIPMTSSVMVV